jgi:hypothetical protein
LYYYFKNGGPLGQRLNKSELLIHQTTQFDLKYNAYAILKYALGSCFTTKITHMEGEEIFGFCKQKFNLHLRSKGDSHRHNCVNFFHPHVNAQIEKLHVQIECLIWSIDQYKVMDITNGSVEVLEISCENGMWDIKWCPPTSHI